MSRRPPVGQDFDPVRSWTGSESCPTATAPRSESPWLRLVARGLLVMFGRLFFLPEFADEHGLVTVGGDLRSERLLTAYRRGIFPWYHEDGPILWWSPDPRAIFELDGLHVSRRLRRTIHSGRFRVSVNEDFAGVI